MTGAVYLLRTTVLLAAVALGSCRSIDPSLGLASTAPPESASAAPATTEARGGPIQFLPVVGIPAERAGALSAALAEAAGANGIAILPADEGIAAYRMKGYLSTVRDPQGALLVYVWDVVDPAGNRLDRIQGQVRASGSGNPWESVGNDTLRSLAMETIRALRAHGRTASASGG